MSGNDPRSRDRPARPTAFRVGGRGLGRRPRRTGWLRPDLAARYDVVVAGVGVAGLAAAYHLAADHGITDVAVIDPGQVGAGHGSGGGPVLLRPGGRTPETLQLVDRSLTLLEHLARDPRAGRSFRERAPSDRDRRPGVSWRSHLAVARDEATLDDLTWQAQLAALGGVDARLVGPDELARLEPALAAGARPPLGGLLRSRAGIVDPGALAWWYARAAAALGVHVHRSTWLLGVDVDDGRVRGVRTSRGEVATRVLLAAGDGSAAPTSALAGLRLPVVTHPAHVLVTEPAPAFLRAVLGDGSTGVAIGQTDRGEVVLSGAADPYPSYSTRATFESAERLAAAALDLVPGLGRLRAHRQATTSRDLTPDSAPILGSTPVDGFLVLVPGGPDAVTVSPAAGEQLARLVATGTTSELLAPFALDRFEAGVLLGERDPAWVGLR